MKAFIGGGLGADSDILNQLKSELKIDHFDPKTLPRDFHSIKIVKDEWESCDYCLYVISPQMKGFDPVVDAVNDSNKRPNKTLYCFLLEDAGNTFTDHQVKSLSTIGKMVENNGARFFESLPTAIEFLNNTRTV
ncbi:MAG: hypothetical protein GQ574_03975 [Crocinitomix sp.]|nr:hypothetical protein [Crocinitomix sp.]